MLMVLNQLLQNIMKSAEVRFPPGKSDLSFECLDLCQRLLRRNPREMLLLIRAYMITSSWGQFSNQFYSA